MERTFLDYISIFWCFASNLFARFGMLFLPDSIFKFEKFQLAQQLPAEGTRWMLGRPLDVIWLIVKSVD